MTETERSFVRGVFGDNERKEIFNNDLLAKQIEEHNRWDAEIEQRATEDKQMLADAANPLHHIPAEACADLLPGVRKQFADNARGLDVTLTAKATPTDAPDYVITDRPYGDLLGLRDKTSEELQAKISDADAKAEEYARLAFTDYRTESQEAYKQLAHDAALLAELCRGELASREEAV